MDENTEEFFANIKKEIPKIKGNSELVKRIELAKRFFKEKKGIIHEGDEPLRYVFLEPHPYGIKFRDDNRGIIEVSVMADLYRPEFMMPSYLAIINSEKKELLYLVEHLGDVNEIPFKRKGIGYDFIDFLENCPELKKYVKHFEDKGYKLDDFDGRKSFGVIPGIEAKFFILDLDCGNMKNRDEIYDGAIFGKGNFKHLAEIYQRLKSPEFMLNL